ncbi:Tryprostatin B 6-hydroxylase [Pleurostoma richardsiae]|uniref:Tryprostatin B 6-hydroxylase n=1 Tax=Pleurostoma richardsiae TaxID=41990 RepID=A0AA38RZV6_9PEZI|nr:Tryprostatin B 6-hydroxylase [Pleurostoma richardsiae]
MALSLVFLCCLSLALVFYRYTVYPILVSPLAKIPSAHWSASVSPLWILYKRFRRLENQALHEAHRRLGPVVRVAPHELSVDGIDAVRTVYQGGFEKAKWYSLFDNYGVPCLFSTRPSREHSLRKRMISNVYSKSYIQSSPANSAQARVILFDRLLPILSQAPSNAQYAQGIDVYSIFLATTMDFISAYIFGISNSTNFLQDERYREYWLNLYKSRNDYPFFPQELPRLTAFLKKLGISPYPSWVDDANRELADWNSDMCRSTLRYISEEEGRPRSAADDAVVTKALLSGLDREQATNGTESLLYPTALLHRELSVNSELFDHLLAGQETAGLALTYLAWHLSQSSELQQELRTELLGLEPNFKLGADGLAAALPDPKQLDSLPLLHAVLMESLRLHAPIPGPQPRQTPYPSSQIGPYTVPGGVRIAALAHTLHRDERVFPDAEKWQPDRWLDSTGADQEMRRERNRQFWAFGSGGRMCIGSNFAMNEMKVIVAAIYSNFTTHIVDDKGIEQGDGYTGRPASEQLYLRFEKA